MQYECKRDLQRNRLVIWDEQGACKDDYRVAMLKYNQIPGLLACTIRNTDERMEFQYDITGSTSLTDYLMRCSIGYEEVVLLLSRILKAAEQLDYYLLDMSGLILEAEFIFRTEQGYAFCYYPGYERDIKEVFHELTAGLVKQIDYKDARCVSLVYELYQVTLDKNYSICEILDRSEWKKQNTVWAESEAEQEVDPTEEEALPPLRTGKGWNLLLYVLVAVGIGGLLLWQLGIKAAIAGVIIFMAAAFVVQSGRKEHRQAEQVYERPEPSVSPLPMKSERIYDNADTVLLSMPRVSGGPVLMSTNEKSAEDIRVTETGFVIGKKEEAVDGCIRIRSVSRMHCRIDRKGEQYLITDLDSTNGTFVNDSRIKCGRPCELCFGDRIQIADLSYLWVYNPDAK